MTKKVLNYTFYAILTKMLCQDMFLQALHAKLAKCIKVTQVFEWGMSQSYHSRCIQFVL